MPRLSPKQQFVLKLIRESIKYNNQAPTIKELQDRLLLHQFKAKSTRTVMQYVDALVIKGFLEKTGEKRGITLVGKESEDMGILKKIPILGTANAGQPITFADQEFQGYLPVSKTIVGNKELYAVKIKGTSMNMENINDGDYAIIDPNSIDLDSGKPHLFVIDDCATVKNYRRIDNNTIVLLPNSTDEHNPIYLHNNDIDGNFNTIGKVVDTLKGV